MLSTPDLVRASISLAYRNGPSDKVYHVQIAGDEASGFDVRFQYGRRGSTLKSGTKNERPLSWDDAYTVYRALIAEKIKKDYSPTVAGTPFLGTPDEARVSGLLPQLLNMVDETEVPALIASDKWLAQEKMDGERRMLRIGKSVEGTNRGGLVVALPEPIVTAAMELPASILDGEQIGDVFYAFDLLELEGRDLRMRPCGERLEELETLIGSFGAIRHVPAESGAARKQALFDRVKAARGEGVVFKRVDSLYVPGRPASGGAQLKFKFTATATVVVDGVNKGKRSVSISVFDAAGQRIPVGNVTIPSNAAIPAAGDLVEVRYLYAYVGGSLFQPVYLHPRVDVTEEACTLTQLKFIPKNPEEADE